MEIGVRIEREDVLSGLKEHAATAYLTFVAVDKDMSPTEVPTLSPETEDEHRRVQEAELRRATRLAHRQALIERRNEQK